MSAILQKMGLRKAPDPVEEAKQWQRKIKQEMRQADREIRELEREEKKAIAEVKKTAKLGARAGSAIKTLAKNVVMARKAKERACMTRASLNSVGMTLAHQISTIKLARCMAASTDVMQAMNDAVKLPQLRAQMQEMAREMEKAGLIEEMVGDAMEDAVGGEELEDAADAEVNKVLEELTIGLFDATGEESLTKLPAKPEAAAVEEETAEEAEELQSMKSRLQAL